MRRLSLLVLALFGVLLAACDMGGNPLIGTWKMVPEKGNPLSEGLGMLMREQTIEFRSDSMIAGGEATKVTYEVSGERVIVYPAGREKGTVYVILDKDRIANELALGQRMIFERVER